MNGGVRMCRWVFVILCRVIKVCLVLSMLCIDLSCVGEFISVGISVIRV